MYWERRILFQTDLSAPNEIKQCGIQWLGQDEPTLVSQGVLRRPFTDIRAETSKLGGRGLCIFRENGLSVCKVLEGVRTTKGENKNKASPGWCSSRDWAQSANQRVTGLIPSQGICLGCGPGSQWGPHERQLHIYVSLPLFLHPFPLL